MSNPLTSLPFMSQALASQSRSLQEQLARATGELTTGKAADIGTALRGDFSRLATVDHGLARLNGHIAQGREAALLAETMQKALETVASTIRPISTELLASTTPVLAARMETAISEASGRFETVIAALNTRLAERSVFGGAENDRPALPPADQILLAMESVIAGISDPALISSTIAAWLSAPGGLAQLSPAVTPLAPFHIAAGESVHLDFCATEPELLQTIAALAQVALLDRGLFAGNQDARADLARASGAALATADTALAELRGKIGGAESRISTALTRNAAEIGALSITRAEMIAADPYETAGRLNELETALERLYLLTARLSALRLTDYLR